MSIYTNIYLHFLYSSSRKSFQLNGSLYCICDDMELVIYSICLMFLFTLDAKRIWKEVKYQSVMNILFSHVYSQILANIFIITNDCCHLIKYEELFQNFYLRSLHFIIICEKKFLLSYIVFCYFKQYFKQWELPYQFNWAKSKIHRQTFIAFFFMS